MRIVRINYLHGHKIIKESMPRGDVLMHTSDITHQGDVKELC